MITANLPQYLIGTMWYILCLCIISFLHPDHPGRRHYYYPHLTKEETEAVKRLTNLHKATQSIRDTGASSKLSIIQ